MAKLKIELELDWFDEESGTVSDEIRNQVVSGLQDRLIRKVETQTRESIETKIKEAADKVSDEFLVKVFEERIKDITIPVKTGTWSSETKHLSFSEFVGEKYDDFLKRKVFDEHGRTPSYDRDAKFTIHEYFVKDMLGKELESKVSTLIAEARQKAEQSVINTLEKNLRDQLSADMIGRLNIPSMLKSLQEKAALFEGQSES
ncbi:MULTISPECIES: hypothetical protein [Paenibacillus]|uniref:hypothetical protein n=1 Tax=Paenibacillus TaxID=44249 RepID=UPI001F30773A|nr:hypothetical protein [Paenibacillus xylanexedens]MCF7753407.1 hypothetical protein [Paenibacillus xylanexedens]